MIEPQYDQWDADHYHLTEENRALRKRVEALEARYEVMTAADGGSYGYVVLGPPDERDEVPVQAVSFGEVRTIDRFKLTYRYKAFRK